MQYRIIDTAWGAFGFVERDNRLVATFLPQPVGHLHADIAQRFPDATESNKALPDFRKQIRNYFKGTRTKFDIQLDLRDLPPFRQDVLKACRSIPYGKTASYGDLARAVGKPAASRAVGSAMAHNPLPLVVPCHRVVRSDGSFGGFSSPNGVEQKKRLLRLEHAVPGVD